MQPFLAAIRILHRVNSFLLAIGRGIGVLAMAVMVLAILIQVFFRYVLGNALPWPDEAARFCMLWMTGLMAPTAFRTGGFVAIDTIEALLPGRAMQMLQIVLLSISLLVLLIAVQIGWSEVTGIGGRFATASLYLPTSLSFDAWFRIPRSWMMMSLLVGIVLLILVNIELILRSIAVVLRHEAGLPGITDLDIAGSE
ncbi:MAG: TRAP transporter small permease subunit [Pseudomonadota bacterium]